ncbi:hypothetical protein TNCT6_07990 [Streptomyces sp. 6-11-2]|nr:hypothetical protein TNCT6_07990 [Streptomyces sp. 6-11-2]
MSGVAGQLVGLDRAREQPGDGDHGPAGGVDGGHGHPVRTRRGEADAQRGGAGGVQADALPRERKTTVVVGEQRGVQCGVEKCGMHGETGRVLGALLGQHDLRIQHLTRAPGGSEALEERTVDEATSGETLVAALSVNGLRTDRRPHTGVEAGARGRGVGQGARGVQRPGTVRSFLRARVHGDRAPTTIIGAAHTDLEQDCAVLRQHQRRGKGEFLDLVAADFVTRADREIQESGARQQDGAHDGVVGEPGVRLKRETTGEEHAFALSELHRAVEQRVSGVGEADDRGGRGRAAGPVGGALERVGRQVDAGGAGAGEECVPVEPQARRVQGGEGGQGSGLLVAVLAQDRDGDGLVAGQRLLRHRGQDPVRTQLQERGHTLLLERGHPVRETDRLTDVAHPVLGRAQLLGPGQGTRQVRHHRNHRRRERQLLGHRPELVQHRIHQGRVERVRHPQHRRLAALRLEPRRDLQHGTFLTRNDHRGRPVDGSDRHLVGEVRDDLVLGRLDGHHRATGRQRLHQTTTSRHQTSGVLQREHPGHMCGRDLTDGVTGHEVRPHTPRLHQPIKRHLNGEQRGLSPPRLMQRTGVLTPHHLPQRTTQLTIQDSQYGIQSLSEHREPAIHLTTHPQPLRTLTREQHRTASGAGTTGDGGGIRLAVGDGGQGAEGVLPAGGQDDGAVVERGTAGRQRVAEVERAQRPALADRVEQAGGLVAQRVGRLAGEDQRDDSGFAAARTGRFRCRCGDRLLQDDVGVGATDTEGGDTGAAYPVRLGPLRLLGEQFDGAFGPVDVGRRGVHVQGPRQHAVPHRHDHLDDTGDTGRGLRVSDVGLQRAEPQGLLVGAVLAVGGDQGLGLDRVTQRRTRTVRLDDVHVAGRESPAGERLADHPLLGRTVGSRQAVGGTVLVDGGAADDREDLVTVAHRVRLALQQEHADALGPADTVRRLGERLGAAVGSETPLAGELDERAGRRHDGHTAGQGERALARPQCLGGPVQGDQGGRAGGVDRDGRTLEAEGVRHPAGGHAARAALALEALELLAAQQAAVVVVHDAGEDAGAAVTEAVRVDTGPLDGLPGGFQQQPLLGVRRQRLTRAHPEEAGVEVARVVQESAGAGVRGAGVGRVRVVQGVDVPAAVGREVGDGVGALADQAPQVLG